MKTQNKYRLRTHPYFGSDDSYGNNGCFLIPHHRISDYFYQCQISDGEAWDHVSVTIKSKIRNVERCPTWEEMCYVKSLFWDEEEEVMQLHPAKKDWVNNHQYCLHLWRPQKEKIPMPCGEMVGVKSKNIAE